MISSKNASTILLSLSYEPKERNVGYFRPQLRPSVVACEIANRASRPTYPDCVYPSSWTKNEIQHHTESFGFAESWEASMRGESMNRIPDVLENNM